MSLSHRASASKVLKEIEGHNDTPQAEITAAHNDVLGKQD